MFRTSSKQNSQEVEDTRAIGIASAKKAIIGTAYRKPIELVEKYANEDFSVLLVGETGAGKELFARLFFACSPREKVKKTINCAAYPDTLLRSEVFGHVKGSFTGAIKDRPGLLKACDGGILFLDELGDASPDFQAALLRVSEGHAINPLGSDEDIKVDTLIIAATNKLSRVGKELQNRFHIVPIPPLQRNDIPLLVTHFQKRLIKKEFLDELVNRNYPGNIRELKRACDDLRVKYGEAIFQKRDKLSVATGDFFDYERFVTEFSTWETNIQPILDKYELKYPYRYQPKPARPSEIKLDLALWLIRNLAMGKDEVMIDELWDDESEGLLGTYRDKIVGPIRLAPRLLASLREQVAKGNLPYFLERLHLESDFDRPPAPAASKPDLSPFLELPYDEAKDNFEKASLKYHLQKNSGSIQHTAKAIKMSLASLKRRFSKR